MTLKTVYTSVPVGMQISPVTAYGVTSQSFLLNLTNYSDAFSYNKLITTGDDSKTYVSPTATTQIYTLSWDPESVVGDVTVTYNGHTYSGEGEVDFGNMAVLEMMPQEGYIVINLRPNAPVGSFSFSVTDPFTTTYNYTVNILGRQVHISSNTGGTLNVTQMFIGLANNASIQLTHIRADGTLTVTTTVY